MGKIVSRLSDEEFHYSRLREMLDIATDGAIGVDGEIEPATSLGDLVSQVDVALASLLAVIDKLAKDVDALHIDKSFLEMHIENQNNIWKNIANAVEDGVIYDEDLDHATMDTMEALIASGMAESTDDCEIVFDTPVAITREDFKPIVRQTIDSWLKLKTR